MNLAEGGKEPMVRLLAFGQQKHLGKWMTDYWQNVFLVKTAALVWVNESWWYIQAKIGRRRVGFALAEMDLLGVDENTVTCFYMVFCAGQQEINGSFCYKAILKGFMPVPVDEIVSIFVKDGVKNGNWKAWKYWFDEFLVVFRELDIFCNHSLPSLAQYFDKIVEFFRIYTRF